MIRAREAVVDVCKCAEAGEVSMLQDGACGSAAHLSSWSEGRFRACMVRNSGGLGVDFVALRDWLGIAQGSVGDWCLPQGIGPN